MRDNHNKAKVNDKHQVEAIQLTGIKMAIKRINKEILKKSKI